MLVLMIIAALRTKTHILYKPENYLTQTPSDCPPGQSDYTWAVATAP